MFNSSRQAAYNDYKDALKKGLIPDESLEE